MRFFKRYKPFMIPKKAIKELVTDPLSRDQKTPFGLHSLNDVLTEGILDKNIVLIGFMGSGKSMVARSLAECLKREVVATDDLIEARAGKPINAIFKDHGENYFQGFGSKDYQRSFPESRGIVIIDCGGGVVLRPENLQHLKNSGIVFLSAGNTGSHL